MNLKSKSRHVNSTFHKRRELIAFTVEKYEFDNPEINQIYFILKDVIKDCEVDYFPIFDCRCDYDIKFEHASSDELFCFTIINDFKLFLSQTERWHKKVGEYKKDGFKFN